MGDYRTRRAEAADIDAIALAHGDSIRTIGPHFYPAAVVEDWGASIDRALYLNAMASGEVFFIAIGTVEDAPSVLGFSSDYRIDGATHGTSVYVRGSAARQGIGSALLALAEAHAIGTGATFVQVEASLAGVQFYRANGFHEVSRGETRLTSGRPIACVFMRKDLGKIGARS
jgi:GNAT superfamily N-acetyltransferase